MRVGLRAVLAFVVVVLLVACGGSTRPAEAPAWARLALQSDADFVGAIDLAAMRADPLFGKLLERFAKNEEANALERGSQVDVFANANDRGDIGSWIAVVHGVSGPPTEKDVGSDWQSAKTFPNAWLLGQGAAFERAKQLDPNAKVSLPAHALMASTLRGHGLASRHHQELDQMTEGLKDATVVVFSGSHLELVGQFHYADDKAAKRAAAFGKIVLVALSKRDWSAKIAAALGQIDFDVSGDTVTLKYTIDDDLRDALIVLVQDDKH